MLTARGNATIVVNGILAFLAVFAVALRFYAKRLKKLSLRASDSLILLALAMTVANSMALIYGATNGGMGKHIQTLTYDEIVVFGKVTFATQFTYLFAVSFVKISILLFYKSIFTSRPFRLAVNVVGLQVLLWTIAFLFASIFEAWPIASNWDLSQPTTTINEFAMYISQAIIELALDVITLALPWTVIWKLHMNTYRKLIVTGIFMLGGFACVSSAFRIYYLTTTNTSQSQDFTYETYDIFIWTAIEPCTGVICACLPSLGPIFQDGRRPFGRSFASLKSYLLQSRERLSDSHSKGSALSDRTRESSKRTGGELMITVPYFTLPEDAIILTSVQGQPWHDVENQDMPYGDIVVRTQMSSCETDAQAGQA